MKRRIKMGRWAVCLLLLPIMASARNIRITMVGDIMMGTTYPDSVSGMYLPQNDGKYLFGEVNGYLGVADLTIGNLEGTLLNAGGEVKKCQDPKLCYAFRMPEHYAHYLKDAGFDAVAIANNHINDFGPTGVNSTVRALQDAGVVAVGLKGRYERAIIEKNGLRYGICAFGHSENTLNINDLEEARIVVSNLHRECDIVIVSFHGGSEGSKATHVPLQKEIFYGEERGDVYAFAHTCIDAGADVVFGHGPHVTRAMELYKGHFIAYSLGNFCTPYRVNLKGDGGIAPIVNVQLDETGQFVSGQVYAIKQTTGSAPTIDAENRVIKRIQQLTAQDFPDNDLQLFSDGKLMNRGYVAEVKKEVAVRQVGNIAGTARKYIGAPYRSGHRGPYAFDCSGLMKFVFAKHGVKLATTSRAQYQQGQSVSINNLKMGDLVFFQGRRRGGGVGHVGMVIDAGNGSFRFIHASRRGVVIDDFRKAPYYISRYVGARRVLK